jgi:hypothetical protein
MTGAIVVARGVAASYPGDPSYSPLSMFVSELGRASTNPLAEQLNRGFVAGGAIATLFFSGVAISAGKRWRGAGVVAAFATAALTAVGLLPLPNLTPHNVAAGLCAFSALFSSLLFARASRRHRRAPTIATVARAFAALQLSCFVGAATFVGARLVQFPADLDVALAWLPWLLDVEIAGHVVNPVAVAEWIVFGSCVAALFALGAAMTYEGLRSAPLPGSPLGPASERPRS